jgi:SAM-dependent methyltransferase
VTMAPSHIRTPHAEQLAFLCDARAAAAVLEASTELGVFDRLERGPVDPATLAERCRIGERAARALLGALASLGLAERHADGTYGVAAYDVNGFIELLRPWDRLADGLRRRQPPGADTLEGAQELYPRMVTSLATMFEPAAAVAAEHLAAGSRVLDLGAGAAAWSLALAAHNPSCRVTAVELPVVLDTTRRAVAAAGCGDRFHFVGADVFAVDLGEAAFDLVISGNLCHLFDESANHRLFTLVARWLAPGGTVAVIDLLSNEQRDGPRAVALYAVGLAQRTASGQAYPFSAYMGWLRAGGFEGVERIELTSNPPVTLVRAHRP